MMLRFRYLLCVAAIAGVCSLAGTSRADLVTYDANADFIANATSATPTSTYGTWSYGYRSNAAGATGTDFTAYNTFDGAGTFPTWYWTSSMYNIPSIQVNNLGGYSYPLSYKEIGMSPSMAVDGGGWGLLGVYNVLRWTAPSNGTINVTTNLTNNGENADATVSLVAEGSAAWNYNIYGVKTAPTQNASLTVVAGQVVDLVVDDNGVNPPNMVGVYHTIDFTAVPEPSGCVLLTMAAFGLLAYAWRRRR